MPDVQDSSHSIVPANEHHQGVEDSYPLSPMQQGMLFNYLAAPNSGVDLEQLVCSTKEDLQIPLFRQAWEQILARHSILRTSFCWEGNRDPRQDVHRQVSLPWTEFDWSHLTEKEQEKNLRNYLEDDRKKGFNLAQAPNMHLMVASLGTAGYLWVWSFHHILLDGRSFPIILRELFSVYEALCSDKPVNLPVLRPYRDYIEWLQNQDFKKSEPFWRNFLQGFTNPTPLLITNRKGELSFHGQETSLPSDLTRTIKNFAKDHGVTVNTMVQAAWAVLLSRYSGEPDVLFGATRACRRSVFKEAEDMVGIFINTLPIRTQLDPGQNVVSWLKSLRDQQVALREYEHTPLWKVQEWSQLPAGSRLFESFIMYDHEEFSTGLKNLGEQWRNRSFNLYERVSYPLLLKGYGEESLRLCITYEHPTFDHATITRMLGHLSTVLEGMVTHADQNLASIPWLTQTELHQLLVEWNATDADFPSDQCIHQLIEKQVEKTPDSIALIFDKDQLTYSELNQRANQVAHHLRKMGVGAEDFVGICMYRSIDMVIGILGILKAGAAYVPLDPNYPAERLGFMQEDSNSKVLITQQSLKQFLPGNKGKSLFLDEDWNTIAQSAKTNPVMISNSNNLSHVIYTSGSTGKPKGVAIEHRSVVALLSWAQTVFEPQELAGILAGTSICFDLSVFELFLPLVTGGKVILAENALQLPTLPRAAEVSMINTVPSAIAELVRMKGIPPTVQTICLAGEPLPQDLVDDLYRIPTIKRVFDLYGPTEDTTYSTYALRQPNGTATIGRPISNTQVYLLDATMQPVPVGVPGDLYLSGAGLARCYLNRPEMTAEKFIPNPFNETPGSRMYKTGDLARYRADGNLEFLGRMDHQVKIRGFRIELGEIENVLNTSPAVQKAVVVAREDNPGDKRLVAYLVANDGMTPLIHDLRKLLEERLPEFMIPSTFIILDAFPLTPNGKIDRKALPKPEGDRPELNDAYLEPRTDTEKNLVQIWTEILGVKKVGIRDNFFEIGGHSLLAIRVKSEILGRFGVDIPLRDFFEYKTIESLADQIDTLAWLNSSRIGTLSDLQEAERETGEV